jgi:L-cystine transport system permease protein
MVGTVFFGSILGFLLAFAKLRGGKLGNAVANVYIYVTRCIPSIVMLFIVYYGLPEFLMGFGININGASHAVFVIITFTILFAATMAEVFRGGYEAIDIGQREAALCVGMSETQAFIRIILPQCTAVVLPNFTNSLVSLMKEGALAYTIGLIDLMGKGQWLIGMNNGGYSLEIYLALFAIYWLLTVLIEKVFGTLERTLSKGKKAAI